MWFSVHLWTVWKKCGYIAMWLHIFITYFPSGARQNDIKIPIFRWVLLEYIIYHTVWWNCGYTQILWKYCGLHKKYMYPLYISHNCLDSFACSLKSTDMITITAWWLICLILCLLLWKTCGYNHLNYPKFIHFLDVDIVLRTMLSPIQFDLWCITNWNCSWKFLFSYCGRNCGYMCIFCEKKVVLGPIIAIFLLKPQYLHKSAFWQLAVIMQWKYKVFRYENGKEIMKMWKNWGYTLPWSHIGILKQW